MGDRRLGWLLLVGGLLGAASAFVLLLEKLALLQDDTYVPSCSINPVLNCGSVMRTDQAEVFGFPNPVIGVALLPAVAATGAALVAGAELARWYWLALQVGVIAGTGFVGWLVFQSLYRIGALCPYCMVVWAVVIPISLAVTLRNLQAGMLGARAAASRVTRVASDWQGLVLTSLAVVLASLILERFWSYWTTVL